MTDRAYEPADANPFHQFNNDGGDAETAPTQQQNPFHQFNSDQDASQSAETSTTGALRRGAERSIVPAIGSFPAIGAGAEVGAELGGVVAGPPGALIGGVLGGAAGGLGASYPLSKAQNWALSQLPDTWKDKLGLSDRQQQIDEGEHPIASFIGGLVPYLVTMRPGAVSKVPLPENATALQHILAHPAAARLFGGAAIGGMELGQEKVEDPNISWPKVAIATAFGMVFNRPTRIGEKITELGAQPARALLGRPSPTLAQAADAKVMGPGVTEDVFQGSQAQDPVAEATAQEGARQEAATLEPPAQPDLHAAARAANPELFAHYDDLLARQRVLSDWFGEGSPIAGEHLQATQSQIAQVAPEVAAAYRRAAEGANAATVPAERFPTMADMLAAREAQGTPRAATAPGTEAEPRTERTVDEQNLPRTIEEQRDFIRGDVARQLIAVGRPQAEAEAAGAVVAARYEARAGRFNGALGTPQELYEREGALIKGAKRPPEAAPTAVSGVPPRELPPSGGAETEQKQPTLEEIGAKFGELKDSVKAQLTDFEQHPRFEIAKGENRHLLTKNVGNDKAPYRITTFDKDGPWGHVEFRTLDEAADDLARDISGGFEVANKAEPEPAVTAPRRAAGPASRDPNTFSLLEFLARNGGIRSDDPLAADLRQSFGGKNKFVPGFGQLIRSPRDVSTAAARSGQRGPMSLDTAREAAVEAGYISDAGEISRGVTQSSIEDLLQAVDREARGEKVYRQGYQPKQREAEPGEEEHHRAAFIRDLDEYAQDKYALTDAERARALQLYEKENVHEVAEVLERLYLEADNREIEQGSAGPRDEPIPGWDEVPALGAAIARPGEAVAAGEPKQPGSGAGGAGGERAAEEVEYFQRRKGQPDLIAEREAEGQEQIPGAERISDAELAQRKANEPLKPSAEQKPMDEGLFGEQGQRELFQAPLTAPTFYSVVARTVDNAKQEKASPQQWLATIRNATGVKPEEMEWLGLDDWLKDQKGTVTKQQIGDYIRANEIQIQEVQKGGAPDLREEQISKIDEQIRELSQWPEKPDVARDPARQAELDELGKQWDALQSDTTPSPVPTKFQSYTLPGGENYRELLMTLPSANDKYTQFVESMRTKYGDKPLAQMPMTDDERNYIDKQINAYGEGNQDVYRSGHWDEPNILAHIRFNDRTIDGKKTLFVEEVQSDWHQAGKRKGYRVPEKPYPTGKWQVTQRNPDGTEVPYSAFDDQQTANEWADRVRAAGREARVEPEMTTPQQRVAAVPDAPFKTTWPELALKRIIRYAAENGYDKVAWTPGEVQAARYDLSKHINEVHYGGGSGDLVIRDLKGEQIVRRTSVQKEELPDIIGKEAADRLLAQEPKNKWRSLSGLDLKVGGEGMKGFYDQILPAAANKLVKKFGARVGKGTIKETAEGPKDTDVHTLDLTPQLKDAAIETGFPLFQQQLGKIRLGGPKPIITLAKTADASTFIHETGHAWLEELMRDADHPQAPGDVKADASTVLDWLGAEKAESVTTRQHEKFARGFEQYMREGVAPSPELAGVFAKFRDWLLRVYQSLKGLGTEITPQIREVFDRMLSTAPQRTVIAPERMERPTLADIHSADAEETHATEAVPTLDRVLAETNQFAQDLPPELQHELATARAATAVEPGAEGGAGAERTGGVGEGGGATGPEPAGGVGRATDGQELPGGGGARAESTAKPASGERPGQPSTTDANLGDKPLAPRPKESVGEEESKFLDKAGNIRLENLTNDNDVRQAIRDAADENEDFIGDRRGVVTDGQVMDLAADLGMEGAEKLVRERVTGQAYNAEQVMALRKLLIQSATDVSALMKRAAEGTDADLMEYARAKARHQMIQGTVAQATAETGRALRAFRDIAGTEGQGDINEFLKQATGKTLFQLRQEAKLGATLNTPQQVSKFINNAQDRNFGRMILEYWINGLISGPATHVTYMVGNTLLALEKAGPETAAAAMIGRARAAMGRAGETVRMGEVAEQIKAGAKAMSPAIKAALDAFRSGVTTMLPGEEAAQNILRFPGQEFATAPMLDEAAKLSDVLESGYSIVRGMRDGLIAGGGLAEAGEPAPRLLYSTTGVIPDLRIGGAVLPLGTIIRGPSRFIAAIHSFFRAVNYSMEKNRLAYRTAMNEGLNGEALDSRIGDLRQNPSDAMMQQARGEATELTLMGQGGAITQALARLTNTPIFGFPLLKFIDPFVHISSNIINQSIIERTPLGVLSPEIRADLMGKNGNVAQDTAMARMLMGSIYAISIGGLAAEGYISGSEPTDPKQTAMWRLAGNQAHSVKVGDTWFDVHRLGPLGMLLGIAADLQSVAHAVSDGDLLLAGSHLQHAITQNILDESFMRGPADLIQAIEDPARYGEYYLRSQLSSFVPFSVGMAQMARASDPYSRQARTVMDQIKAKVPFESQALLPKRDIWGEEIPNKPALLAAGVTAIYEQRLSHDPVNLALYDLGIYPAQLERKIRNVQLTDQQYDDYQRIGGRMTKMRLNAIVNSPDFATWPNHVKAQVIREVITQSREASRGMMMAKYPQIPRDATAAKLKKLQD